MSSKETEAVEKYMAALDYPLIEEVEALRKIIKSNKQLSERIKWNAPSYYTNEDLLTFNFHNKKLIRIIFHHPAIVKIKSGLLEGDYVDRRIMHFADMKSVKANKKELVSIISKLIELAEK